VILSKGKMKNLGIFFLTVFFSCVVLSTAMAYTPPESFVMEKVAKSHGKIKKLEIEGKVVDLKLQGSFNELLRLDFVTRTGSAIATNQAGDVLGQKTFHFSELSPMGAAWLVLGFDPNAAELKRTLERLNLTEGETPVKLSHYRIPGSQVVTWSWGDTNHIHFTKDNVAFAGIQLASTENQPGDELLTQDFNVATGDFSFPKSLHLNRGTVELFTYEVKTSHFNSFSKTVAPKPASAKSASPAVQEWFDLVR
jgi:hypothetical protein